MLLSCSMCEISMPTSRAKLNSGADLINMAGASVIRDQTLFHIHLLERLRLRILLQPFAALPEEWAFHLAGAFHRHRASRRWATPSLLLSAPTRARIVSSFRFREGTRRARSSVDLNLPSWFLERQ